MNAPALTYALWHLVGGVPVSLGSRDDRAAALRVLQREPRSVIARQGVVLQQREELTAAQLKLLRDAAAKAWAEAGGAPPEPPPVPEANPRPSKFRGGEPMAYGRRTRAPERPLSTVPSEPAPPPAAVERRPPRPAPSAAPEETPAMPAAATTCPCGEPSAPTNTRAGGRPSVPEFADLCQAHRTSAQGRLRRGSSETPADARAASLVGGEVKARPAPPSKKVAKRPKAKPAKTPRKAAPEAGDLLSLLRRQRAVVESLGGIEAAEAHVAMVERVGAEQLAAIVDELSGGA